MARCPGSASGWAEAEKKQPWTVPLIRTNLSEAARLQLRPPLGPLPTLASVARLIDVVNGDPARQSQRIIRTKLGWCWSCPRCKRELEGEDSIRPIRCPKCHLSGFHLDGHETLVFYLADARGFGGGYDAGMERVNLLCGFPAWVEAVGGWRVRRAVDGWLRHESYRTIAQIVGRSHTWIPAAVESVRTEWERA